MVAENKAEKNHATLITTYPKGGGSPLSTSLAVAQ